MNDKPLSAVILDVIGEFAPDVRYAAAVNIARVSEARWKHMCSQTHTNKTDDKATAAGIAAEVNGG